MATYSIQSEGNHIVPYNLQVTFDVDVSFTNTHRVVSGLEGQEFDDFFTAYALRAEEGYKTLPEFITQDQTRNSTYSMVTIGPSAEKPGETEYDITINFTIENAVAQTNIVSQTDLTGTEKDTFLQTAADNEAINFKYGHNFVDL